MPAIFSTNGLSTACRTNDKKDMKTEEAMLGYCFISLHRYISRDTFSFLRQH